MEYDLSIILTEELHKKYSLEQDFGSMNTLYNYIKVRAGVALEKKKIDNLELMRFILSELNIETFRSEKGTLDELVYNSEAYSVGGVANDFFENFEFRADLEGPINFKKIRKEIDVKGYKKASKFRKSKSYKSYIKYNRLKELNEKFGTKPISLQGAQGFKKSPSHNPFKRTLEESLEANIVADKFIESDTTTYISESDLEEYMIKNLSIIEDGLVYVGSQIKVDGGVIDVLAKDKNNVLTVIELKIDEDKRLIWQAIHYPEEIKSKYKTDKVRMITVSPSYSSGILSSLKYLGYVEIYDYKIVANNKITDVALNLL